MSTQSENLKMLVTPEVVALGVRGYFIALSGLKNSKQHPDFEKFKNELCERLRDEYSKEFIKNDPVLQGFRDLHTKVGRSNRRFPAASEALISLLIRTGQIPSINLVVDIYNCVSIESRLALGAHDIAKIEGNVTLRTTNGDENFVPLGSSENEKIEVGEYCYIDEANDVICRLEYKQVEKTKVTNDTQDCFYVLQGNPNTSKEYLRSANDRLIDLTKKYCGGTERILCEV